MKSLIFNIWSFLSENDKKKFILLIGFSIIVLFLELLSISTIFPFIYSLIDENFLDKYIYLKRIYDPLELKNSYFSIFVLFFLLIIVVIKNLFLTFFYWNENKFMYETQENFKETISNLIKKDYPFHIKNNSADLITRVRTDSVVIRESITALFNFIQSFIFIFGILMFLVF